MILPLSVPLLITFGAPGVPQKMVAIVLKELSTDLRCVSLDDRKWITRVLAKEKDMFRDTDHVDLWLYQHEIISWKRFKLTDAPLTINWGFLSDRFLKKYFGR